MSVKPISISIVSHGQLKLMKKLLIQIEKYAKIVEKVIITINIPEEVPECKLYKSKLFLWIINKSPLGFGENHNNAFKRCTSNHFCILNPDILIKKNTLSNLLSTKEKYNIGIVGPSLVDSFQKKQVNARKFPSIISTLYHFNKIKPEYFIFKIKNIGYTDWIGGMFMLINTRDFKLIGGFDENFFLYFEDVDLCYRAKKKGITIAECSGMDVIHNARRSSHKNFKYFIMHINSFLKYFLKHRN